MQARSKVENSYLFHIEGIRCHSCIGKIENIKTMEPAISHAHMYFGESILEIKTSKAIEPKSVLQLIDQMGFKGQYLQKESDNFELQKQQNRKLLSKVGVAGFIAGNIMLFSIPIYSGLEEGSYKISFSYISFFLFLPIVAYCAVDLYKNAYYSLKNKSLSIDLPISIALLSGFFLSVFNLLIGEYDYLYFDSTASFIFLILSSRYFLQRVQQNFVYSNRVNSVLEAKVYRVSRQGQQLNLNAKDILPGDTLDLEVNDIIPVDGVLANEISEIDTSFISGESLPQIFHQKMKVLSGSINLSPQTKVVSSTRYSSSQIQQIFEKVEEVKKTKGHYSQIADKAAHWLISIVFAVAAVFFVYYYFIDPMEAFQRALALLIVACPCALALGTPLAYALGVQRAKQKNILIKDQNILDKVLEIKNLFFDKTGTITRGQLELKTEEVEPSLKNVVLNLEKISNHPIAFAFRRAWPEDFRPLLVTNAQEKVGVGVEGNIDGVFYQLVQGSGEYGITVDLIADSKKLYSFAFFDPIRAEAPALVQSIKDRFENVFLLSGDSKSNVEAVAHRLGLEVQQAFSQQSPIDKQLVIQSHPKAMMIGDGINDALAIQEADVGISVSGSVALSLETAKVYFLKSGIGSLADLFDISNKVRRCLKSNMAISFFYNSVAGVLALMGIINPLVAAILMPISSFVLILNTLRIIR